MASQSVLIRVPATVGSFGGAQDCSALALDATLNVKVTPRLDGHVGIRYFGESGERVPRDRSNLVVRAMEAALHLKELEFTGTDLEIYSSVPVAVGLGSSTAAVLAGLVAADRLFRLQLDEKTLFELAAIYEIRSDNLRAAWFGGFVACVEEGGAITHRRTHVPENLVLNVVVPETQLLPGTRLSPLVAGDSAAGKDQSVHFDRARALAEFFAQRGDGPSAGLDISLPPTCEKNVAGLEEALHVRTPGLLSAFVCGTGPAVGIFAQGNAEAAVRAVRECFARHGVSASAFEFRPSNAGAADWNAVHPQITLPPTRGLAAPAEKTSPLPV